MPTRMQYPCKGCGKPSASRYCDACQAKQPKRIGSTARGYDYRWQNASKAFLKLPENRICRDPHNRHEGVVVLASETDHIIPHKGDMRLFWDRKNWQGLCHDCHSYKTALEDGGFGR